MSEQISKNLQLTAALDYIKKNLELFNINKRDAEVIFQLLNGKTYKQIARDMNRAPNLVRQSAGIVLRRISQIIKSRAISDLKIEQLRLIFMKANKAAERNKIFRKEINQEDLRELALLLQRGLGEKVIKEVRQKRIDILIEIANGKEVNFYPYGYTDRIGRKRSSFVASIDTAISILRYMVANNSEEFTVSDLSGFLDKLSMLKWKIAQEAYVQYQDYLEAE